MATQSELARAAPDLTDCDREPIHFPGAIQPHGLLLVADPESSLKVVAGAGEIEALIAPDWLGRKLGDLLQQDIAGAVIAGPGGSVAGRPVDLTGGRFDLTFHRAGEWVLAELEPVGESPLMAGEMLAWMDTIAAGFERSGNLNALCERAATAFRALTGFDRVMVYRFLDDDAGRVVGEDRDPALGSFLHHHFPAGDIPRQARALYVRNRTRVIPTADYAPQPLRPSGYEPIDLSDVAIRSVSPIHLQYLRNMGVAASASISIVKDGMLWGLVACHHMTPKAMSRDVRMAAAALACGLARQIRAKEEAESYRERLTLRAAEDSLIPSLRPPLARAVADRHDDLSAMLDSDGLAIVHENGIDRYGICPDDDDVHALATWLGERNTADAFVTHRLAENYPAAAHFPGTASGVLALALPEERATLIWFRAEQVEEVEWAGNPHKGSAADPGTQLTPRRSFASWTETVRQRSRRWSLEQIESAHRLRRAMRDANHVRERQRLYRELERVVAEKDAALAQKDVLMKEVDHRVQNSLQLVSAFLSLQARDAGPGVVADQLIEARSRLTAVALVHRRLYRDDQIESIDLSRYLGDLIGDLKTSLGSEWAKETTVDLAPVLVPTDRAVSVGLVAAELIINATKYAYGGSAGPIDVTLEQHRNKLRLIVADRGRGKAGDSAGFGSRMMGAVMTQLGGTLEHADNEPGLRAILTAPIEDRLR